MELKLNANLYLRKRLIINLTNIVQGELSDEMLNINNILNV